MLAEITPKVLAGYKTQRRIEQAAPATINKELQLVRHAFNRGDARMGMVPREPHAPSLDGASAE